MTGRTLSFDRPKWHNLAMSYPNNIRRDPPNVEPNNQDVFVWSLYLLGGADRDVVVEDVCLKCYEIAPARFSWRTHPEYPDGIKGLKALSVAERKSHIGLVIRPNKFTCRLTIEGIRWIESYKSIFESIYSKANVTASKNTNLHERKRFELKNSLAWQKFMQDSATLEISDVATALQCSAASPISVWTARVNELRRTGDLLSDQEILEFSNLVEMKFLRGNKLS